MYKDFYNLKENPFNVTADPDFFFSSTRHEEAFSHLIYGIEERKGILAITGEIGTGKTTLCKTLLSRLDERTKTALILYPNFSNTQLLKLIIKDLGIEGKFSNKFSLINALNEFLLSESAKGNNIVLIVDEAQNLKPNQLEQVRLLSNLETEKEKLLQIILVGQPELYEKLKLESLRQLNQRIAVRYHVIPLEKEEIKPYILHRLKVASKSNDNSKAPKFNKDAIDVIYQHSKGTPRVINILCDRSLLAGFIKETYLIDAELIHKCAAEIN